ncbi:MAG: LysM peptidoglycan-binding domain-containing protein [Planctomycetota bacterium]|nr:LysM peptidoglycan-binding domain-containing protein [Planctomycetota bacterium]
MRALLGILVLVGLCLAAAGWQGSRTRAQEALRGQQHGLGTPELPAGPWSLLVLGEISGAEPIPGAQPLPRAPDEPAWEATPSDDWPSDPGGDFAPPAFGPDYRYVVRDGDYLGGICDQHYGSAARRLVRAVARYNNLASPDDIRAGKPILLPDRTLLDE